MNSTVLIVPGYHGSGAAHWQSWLQDNIPGSQRVSGIDWETPILPRWAEQVGKAIDASPQPLWVVAHSFGCLASAIAIAQHPRKVAGAILVAPADPERFSIHGVRDRAQDGKKDSVNILLPQGRLAETGLLIASENDPWLTFSEARKWAGRWELPLYNARQAGHINTESGFGPWPVLLELLKAMVEEQNRCHFHPGARVVVRSSDRGTPLSKSGLSVSPSGNLPRAKVQTSRLVLQPGSSEAQVANVRF